MERNRLKLSLTILLFTGIFVFSLHDRYALAEDFRFNHLAIDDGLSQNLVYTILQDRKGFMWFGTKDGLNRYDGYNFTIFRHDPFDSTSISGNEVKVLHEDRAGNLWIGATGLNRFDPITETFVRFLHDPMNPNTISDDHINALYEDSRLNGVLWIGTSNGLNRLVFNRASQQNRALASVVFTRYLHDPQNPQSLSNNRVGSVLVDHTGVLWLGTEKGLNASAHSEPEAKLTFIRYTKEASPPYYIKDDLITALFEDTRGNLWVGTASGLLFLDRNKADRLFSQFKHFPYPASAFAVSWQGIIQTIHEMPGGKLWLGTLGGLAMFDPANGTYHYLRHDPTNPQSINSNNVLSIYQDQGCVLWFGTAGNGLSKLDPHTKAFQHYSGRIHRQEGREALSVRVILEDRSGLLWIYANGQLHQLERATGQWQLS